MSLQVRCTLYIREEGVWVSSVEGKFAWGDTSWNARLDFLGVIFREKLGFIREMCLIIFLESGTVSSLHLHPERESGEVGAWLLLGYLRPEMCRGRGDGVDDRARAEVSTAELWSWQRDGHERQPSHRYRVKWLFSSKGR